jgi:hypothetical protein
LPLAPANRTAALLVSFQSQHVDRHERSNVSNSLADIVAIGARRFADALMH